MPTDFYVVSNLEGTLEENINVQQRFTNIILKIKDTYNLNLDNLDRIVFSRYFSEELNHLSLFTKSKQQITYTKEDYALAVAKIINIYIDEELKQVLVFNQLIYNMFVSEKEEENFAALATIHHELAHIHDHNNKLNNLDDYLTYKYSIAERRTLPLAEAVWDEFYANYKSSKSINETSMIFCINNVKVGFETFEENVMKKKLDYQLGSIDLDTFLDYLARHANFLYKSFAYLLGYLIALEQEDTSFKDMIKVFTPEIEGHLIEPIINKLGFILKDMLKKYPQDWNNYSIYNELKNNVIQYYTNIGVTFRMDSYLGENIEYAEVYPTKYDKTNKF